MQHKYFMFLRSRFSFRFSFSVSVSFFLMFLFWYNQVKSWHFPHHYLGWVYFPHFLGHNSRTGVWICLDFFSVAWGYRGWEKEILSCPYQETWALHSLSKIWPIFQNHGSIPLPPQLETWFTPEKFSSHPPPSMELWKMQTLVVSPTPNKVLPNYGGVSCSKVSLRHFFCSCPVTTAVCFFHTGDYQWEVSEFCQLIPFPLSITFRRTMGLWVLGWEIQHAGSFVSLLILYLSMFKESGCNWEIFRLKLLLLFISLCIIGESFYYPTSLCSST